MSILKSDDQSGKSGSIFLSELHHREGRDALRAHFAMLCKAWEYRAPHLRMTLENIIEQKRERSGQKSVYRYRIFGVECLNLRIIQAKGTCRAQSTMI